MRHRWSAPVMGLSPRRRGNRPVAVDVRRDTGPIPAQAREPAAFSVLRLMRRAYPRAGGGTGPRGTAITAIPGLSPRRRGNRGAERRARGLRGPIPAQAGEPGIRSLWVGEGRAYPRAGGGTFGSTAKGAPIPGLSPRRRGNPRPPESHERSFGPIPAQAGEPASDPESRSTTGAYPRAGGGTMSICSGVGFMAGLSPRRRGNLLSGRLVCCATGPIPAQAGEPSCSARRRRDAQAYPRAGGGTVLLRPPEA